MIIKQPIDTVVESIRSWFHGEIKQFEVCSLIVVMSFLQSTS